MPPDEDIPDDDLDPTQRQNNGVAIGVGLVVAVLVVVCLVGAIYTAAASNPPGATMCSTTCLGFVRLECPGARPMGGCFAISVCDQPVHMCGINPP